MIHCIIALTIAAFAPISISAADTIDHVRFNASGILLVWTDHNKPLIVRNSEFRPAIVSGGMLEADADASFTLNNPKFGFAIASNAGFKVRFETLDPVPIEGISVVISAGSRASTNLAARYHFSQEQFKSGAATIVIPQKTAQMRGSAQEQAISFEFSSLAEDFVRPKVQVNLNLLQKNHNSSNINVLN